MTTFRLNTTDLEILKSFCIFPYLTAEQVCELHYSRGSLKYVMARLTWLVKERYLNRTERPMLYPFLYSLALRGTRLLEERPLFYPLAHKTIPIWQYPHLLLTSEVLISSAKLPGVSPDMTLMDMKHDFTLKHMLKGVVPDGWVHLRKNTEQVPIWFEITIALREAKFKEKIKGILQSVRGEYREVFGTEYVTVSFLTPIAGQVATMMQWTQETLVDLGELREADLFRFAHIPERDIDPIELFTKPMHQWLFSHGAGTSLI